jgi:tetratricopeptide (TPR) repeat protein
MDRHPEPHTLVQFAKGRLSRRHNRKIVRHLLAGCDRCRSFTERLLPAAPGSPSAPVYDYRFAFSSTVRSVELHQMDFAEEQAEAAELLRALVAQPEERRCAVVEADSSFRSWALCERALDASYELGFQDPGRALELARIGVDIALRLDRGRYGPERVYDLAARAWATLGNAERIRTDFRAAEQAFAEAGRLLRKGTGDPLEEARLLLLRASLLGRQQRLDEAFRALDRAARIGRRAQDSHLYGKALIMKGFLAGTADETELSVRLLSEGIARLTPEDARLEPRLLVSAFHNLALVLTEAGRPEEGRKLAEQARPLYLRLGDRMNLIRLRWLEGKIALALGDLARAEATFVEVRDGLAEHELGHDAALLLLDLARVYAQQGRAAELRELAGEMLAIARSRQVPREALSALILFQRAAEMERVTLGLVQDLGDSLRETRPGAAGFRFRDPD